MLNCPHSTVYHFEGCCCLRLIWWRIWGVDIDDIKQNQVPMLLLLRSSPVPFSDSPTVPSANFSTTASAAAGSFCRSSSTFFLDCCRSHSRRSLLLALVVTTTTMLASCFAAAVDGFCRVAGAVLAPAAGVCSVVTLKGVVTLLMLCSLLLGLGCTNQNYSKESNIIKPSL